MSNGINKRQNEENSIKLLAAQKQLYKEAKVCNNLMILFSVFVPLILSAMVSLFESSIIQAFMYIGSIMCFVIVTLLNNRVTILKRKAATIQQKFDIYVFGMNWNNDLFGHEEELVNEIVSASDMLLSKAGEKIKLYNWYTEIADTVNLEEGIWICQKENFHWDVNLRRRFKIVCYVVTVFCVLLIFTFGIISKELVAELLMRFVFVLPVIQWLEQVIKEVDKDIEHLNELNNFMNEKVMEMDKLQIVQSKIYDHRKSCYLIPEFIYNYCKQKDEITAYKIAKCEIDNQK